MKIGQALYEQSSGGDGGGASAGDAGDASEGESASSDDTVVDADFEEVDDDKKGHQA
jgi:molecular chaperone DnaK